MPKCGGAGVAPSFGRGRPVCTIYNGSRHVQCSRRSRYSERLLYAATARVVSAAVACLVGWLTGTSCRQDFAVERLHARFLHTSIVCEHIKLRTLSLEADRCDSEPTVFENYVHDLYVDDTLVELSLWDTAGTVSAFLQMCPLMSPASS